MKLNIILSWSKLVALIMLLCAVHIDTKNGLGGTVFMFSLPFVVFLITGKQLIDKNKPANSITEK